MSLWLPCKRLWKPADRRGLMAFSLSGCCCGPQCANCAGNTPEEIQVEITGFASTSCGATNCSQLNGVRVLTPIVFIPANCSYQVSTGTICGLTAMRFRFLPGSGSGLTVCEFTIQGADLIEWEQETSNDCSQEITFTSSHLINNHATCNATGVTVVVTPS